MGPALGGGGVDMLEPVKISGRGRRAVFKLYRYLSGIYHFFDSFGKCGKKSGIGMVLVF